MGNNVKHTYEFVKEEFDKRGFTLISEEYTNGKEKLDFICSNGHEHKISYNNLQKGGGCIYCSGKAKYTIEYIKEDFDKQGYKILLDNYKNRYQKFDVICPSGHTYSTNVQLWQIGRRCPECSIIISKSEIEVRNYIESFGVEVVSNDRTTILNQETGRYLELDILIPDMKKAVEFNGEYWHSLVSVKKRDEYKKRECERLGISLIVINERDWYDNIDECKKQIREFIGV